MFVIASEVGGCAWEFTPVGGAGGGGGGSHTHMHTLCMLLCSSGKWLCVGMDALSRGLRVCRRRRARIRQRAGRWELYLKAAPSGGVFQASRGRLAAVISDLMSIWKNKLNPREDQLDIL